MTETSTPRPRSQSVYRGPTREDCLRQASDDDPKATAAGYIPISQTWSEEPGVQVLTIIYEQQLVPAVAVPEGVGRSYPISVRIDRDRRINRLWGIPLLGIAVRGIVLIPQFILLTFWTIAVAASFLVTWIPVLITGHMPQWGFALLGGYIRFVMRVTAYLALMAIPYPGFGSGPNEAFDVTFDGSQHVNRLWGIPLLGFYARAICLIPTAIGLWILGIVASLATLVTWIPVLIYGRYPDLGYDIVGGYIRWSARAFGWFAMLAGPYPPFRLGD